VTGAGQFKYTLDASALLALMLGEPGEEMVGAILDRSCIHCINVAEVVNKLIRAGVPPDEAFASVEELHLPTIQEFSLRQAGDCGQLIAETKKQGLGLGDCVCLTVSAWLGATAVTAERLWKKLEGFKINRIALSIQLIR